MPEDLPVVPSMDDFNALLARVTALEAQIKVMPAEVKTALTVVLGWIEANV
jgi:hypothetical protein